MKTPVALMLLRVGQKESGVYFIIGGQTKPASLSACKD